MASRAALIASLAIMSVVLPAGAGAKPDHGADTTATAVLTASDQSAGTTGNAKHQQSASTNGSGKGRGPGGSGPPGQLKKAAPTQAVQTTTTAAHAATTAPSSIAGATATVTGGPVSISAGATGTSSGSGSGNPQTATATPPTTSATAATAAAPTTAATTPPTIASAPVVSAATPAAPGARSAHRRHRSHRSRGRHTSSAVQSRGRATTGSNAHETAKAANAPAARSTAGAATGREEATSSAHRQRAAAPTSAGGFAAPLTRTVTRIVGVLPKPLRFALAALVALGLALALAIGWMTIKARRLRRAGRRLAADLGLLEATLVPAVPAKVGPASVTAAHRAWDALAAGGDFYDAFELGVERMGLVMGDVEGHGRPALPLTASVRYTLRAFLEAGLQPRDALRVAAGALGHTLGDRLVTAVVAVYDSGQGTLTYACAGHPAPLIIGAPFESPAAGSSPPIGAALATGRRQVTTPLRPGTAAVFYTDGAIDPRMDRSGTALTRAMGLGGPDIGADELLGRLLQHAELPDDTSACVVRPLPGAAHGTGEHVEELELDALGLARSGKRFLSACGAAPLDIDRALASARKIADQAGAVNITVRRREGNTEVTAAAPTPPSLPVAKPAAAAA